MFKQLLFDYNYSLLKKVLLNIKRMDQAIQVAYVWKASDLVTAPELYANFLYQADTVEGSTERHQLNVWAVNVPWFCHSQERVVSTGDTD